MRLSAILTAFGTLASMGAQAGVVSVINGYSVTYPGNKFGVDVVSGVPTSYVKIPAAKEYWLDYQVWFENDWQWVKGGKLPGLVGGSHTSGCKDIVPDGWSARFMWHENGGGHFYYYHQNRQSGCGDTRDFSGGMAFKKMAWNRITEHVIVNEIGKSDGSAQAWLNGVKVTEMSGIKWRGSVGANTALIDNVSLQTFYGGSTSDWSPSQTTHSRFSALIVTNAMPDLSKPFEVPTALGAPLSEAVGWRDGQRMAVTYLGNGVLAPIPAGAEGARIVLADLRGRSAGELSWDGTRWFWTGGTAPVSMRAGVLMARYQAPSPR